MDNYEQEKLLDKKAESLMTFLDEIKNKLSSDQYLQIANRLMKVYNCRLPTWEEFQQANI